MDSTLERRRRRKWARCRRESPRSGSPHPEWPFLPKGGIHLVSVLLFPTLLLTRTLHLSSIFHYAKHKTEPWTHISSSCPHNVPTRQLLLFPFDRREVPWEAPSPRQPSLCTWPSPRSPVPLARAPPRDLLDGLMLDHCPWYAGKSGPPGKRDTWAWPLPGGTS